MRSMLRRLWHQQSGQDIPEYALLVALIAIGILAAIYTYGLANSNTFGGATDGLNAAAPSSAQAGGGGSGGSGGSGSGSGGQSGSAGSGQSGSGSGGDGSGSGGSGSGSGGSGGSGGQFPTNPTPVKQPQPGSGGSQ